MDYGEILKLASEQNLQALVCEKLCETREFTTSGEYARAAADTVGLVAGQSARTEAFLELYRKFEKAGLQLVIMKGIICRELYGKFRDHRPSGDEDILVRQEDFPAMRKVMEDSGYRMEMENVSDQELEVLQEITFNSAEAGLHIEVHTNPMGSQSEMHRQMNRYFRDIFGRKSSVQIGDVKVWTMDPTDHFLFLILHALKHWVAGGIGIRQELDICLFCQTYGEEIDWKYIEKSLRETNAGMFFNDLLFIGNQWLGFQLKVGGVLNCPEELLDDLLKNGMFGNFTQAQRTAGSMIMAATEQKKTYDEKKSVFKAIFPGIKFMRIRFPILVEKPWLLPVYWVVRWGFFLQHNRENGGNLARESIRISQRRISLLRKYKIIR